MARTALGPAESGHLLPPPRPAAGIPVPASSLPRRTRGPRSCVSSLSWPGLVRDLRDPLIDDFSDSCREWVAADAALCGMSARDFDIQLRLHAPSVRDHLDARRPHPLVHDALRPRLVARWSRITAYTEDADLLADSALLPGGGSALTIRLGPEEAGPTPVAAVRFPVVIKHSRVRLISRVVVSALGAFLVATPAVLGGDSSLTLRIFLAVLGSAALSAATIVMGRPRG